MSWLLRFIPGGSTLWLIAGAAFVSVVLWGGVQTKRLGWAKAETQEVRNAWTLEKAQLTATALDAATKYRAHEAELTAKVKGAQDEYNALQGKHARAIVAERAALAESGKLRGEIAAYASGGGTAPGDTCTPERDRAIALGQLLAEALRVSAEGAAEAEANGDAVRALLSSWPR